MHALRRCTVGQWLVPPKHALGMLTCCQRWQVVLVTTMNTPLPNVLPAPPAPLQGRWSLTGCSLLCITTSQMDFTMFLESMMLCW